MQSGLNAADFAMVCLLPALWVHLSINVAVAGYMLVPVGCNFEDYKALLVISRC